MPEQIVVSYALINAVVQFLVTKPFSEVDALMTAIRNEVGPQLPPPEEVAAEETAEA